MPTLQQTPELDLSPAALVQRSLGGSKANVLQPGSQAPPLVVMPCRHSGPQGSVEPHTVVDDPSAWTASEMLANPQLWTYQLSEQDIAELDAAVLGVEARADFVSEVSSPRSTLGSGQAHSGSNTYLNLHDIVTHPKDFALPTLGPKLAAIKQEIVSGRGFKLIRGVPVQRYTRQQSVIAYWGMGLYWGRALSQNKKGHLLGHVKDIGFDVRNPETRIYGTTLAQPFHTDISDIVGLLALQNAAEGGLSSWSSSVSVHNELLQRGRGDLVKELAGHDWWLDRKGEIPQGAQPFFRLPIFHYHKGFLNTSFSDTYYQLAQRHAEVPRMTPKQAEALQTFAALAQSDELRLDLELQPGDIQLLNNMEMLHSRSAFRDHVELDKKRHLLRLWVSPEDNRPLPDVYANLWGSTKPGFRGGLVTPGQTNTIALEAE